jgi:hypothetical protein
VLVVDEHTGKPLTEEERSELLRENGLSEDIEREPAPWDYF